MLARVVQLPPTEYCVTDLPGYDPPSSSGPKVDRHLARCRAHGEDQGDGAPGAPDGAFWQVGGEGNRSRNRGTDRTRDRPFLVPSPRWPTMTRSRRRMTQESSSPTDPPESRTGRRGGTPIARERGLRKHHGLEKLLGFYPDEDSGGGQW